MDQSEDRFVAPRAVDRAPLGLFICIHQEAAQVAQGLLLCAVVICPWPMKRVGMTRAQADTVGLVQAQLIGDHLAGRFPDGDAYAFWLDLATGKRTVLDIPNQNWLRHRMRDYMTITLNVPHAKARPDDVEFLN
jgi:hypothetical protein